MHGADRNERRPNGTSSEGYVACVGACHDGRDGARSIRENAVPDAEPQDDTQDQQTHQGLQWQAQQKQNSQEQNDDSSAWAAAGDAVIGAMAGTPLAARSSELDMPVASGVARNRNW